MLVAAPVAAGWPFNLFSPPEFSDQTRDVIFVGNNWEGTVNVIDAETYEPLG
ncbi:MAG TPA: serine/threonine protein kinase, partial [Alcanivorax sp.]|nr:serine/threonine protein kinase [Alcanivorax sp.]HCR79971.1 serine/threonine protein kinase [Alcanivorax sp.]